MTIEYIPSKAQLKYRKSITHKTGKTIGTFESWIFFVFLILISMLNLASCFDLMSSGQRWGL